MPITLLDIPDEVITYIVECLPQRQRIVVELLDVLELRNYALQLLYQTIVITKTKREYDPVEVARSFTGDYEFIRRHLTPFIDCDQFVAMINEERASFVKNITFRDPYVLLPLHEAHPESLEHVIITFSFSRSLEYRIDLDIKLFLDQFMKLPYNIVAIDQFGGFVVQLSGKRRTELDSPKQEVLRIKQLEGFENLTSLELESDILDTSLGDTPRTLKHLKCDILMLQDPNTFKLDFPAGLESLHTNCKAVPGGPTRGYTDLKHSQNLKKFTTYQGTHFKLPRNLREFDAPGIPDMVKLIRECPFLTALKCSDEDVQRDRLDDSFNLPRELKALGMRDQFYFNLQIFRLTQKR
ncbi:hypothetical protein Cantr_06456 [Candida viswanathii]|uniref:F-box domain-containing protein n=1 Tax=Candida viswanathii TaxID=5486 RepID=A0A367XWS5_9ASCO|nr:hypothetical protein Cantr_06456 [Candida viswanathii]